MFRWNRVWQWTLIVVLVLVVLAPAALAEDPAKKPNFAFIAGVNDPFYITCLLYTSPSPRDS